VDRGQGHPGDPRLPHLPFFSLAADKAGIKCEIQDRFGYDLAHSLDAIGPTYDLDVSCQGSVPESLIAFLESTKFESAVPTPFP